MASPDLKIHDQRTNRDYEIEISNGTIAAPELRRIKVEEDDFGLMSYDPAFKNTASTRSAITLIDGANGVLLYRGYPIEQLAEQGHFLETAYLLLTGELPGRKSLGEWKHEISVHTMLHEDIKDLMKAFRYDAHPMGMLVSTVAALSTYYPEAKNVRDPETRLRQIHRLIAKLPTIAAYTYRHSRGLPFVEPDNTLSYTGNFLNMLFKMTEPAYEPNPVLEKTLDLLFLLHADHEQNCSATTMRGIGSSLADPYSAVAGAAAALSGPLHGGANQAVLRMLYEIGDPANVPEFIDRVKQGEQRLMGFGHRVYKNYDPRAKIIKNYTDEVFEVTGRNPLLDVAIELEKIAMEDDYFVERRLYPNVDFYSGIIYQAMGLPVDLYPVLFAVARTAGWLSQWVEMLEDEEQRIARPRQIYVGPQRRDYKPLDQR